jgi:hypothetical protein
VQQHTWGTFRDIGKIRVGVKTCADKIFIRSDWSESGGRPELLRPLTTHHVGRQYKSASPKNATCILYPHESVDGKRQAVDLDLYPIARRYLEEHRSTLEARKYVIEAGRQWYEVWVPQNPALWSRPKLVFRDISVEPTFWIDQEGTVVNGDCYWMVPERAGDESLLWLAVAVANSSFIKRFYDRRFNNKLYSGRRRFITQYVEQFPLPEPFSELSKKIIVLAKKIYRNLGCSDTTRDEREVDELVTQAFGLSVEKPAR